uniref:Uncharacterized protein n=1 Tax=Anguilla anguilla TaxID=7936 RepID=A0A0E9WGM7_ANGAN
MGYILLLFLNGIEIKQCTTLPLGTDTNVGILDCCTNKHETVQADGAPVLTI